MIVKLLTEHLLEFLSVTGGYRGLSESTHVKMPHCWKSHALANMIKPLATPLYSSDTHIDTHLLYSTMMEMIRKYHT